MSVGIYYQLLCSISISVKLEYQKEHIKKIIKLVIGVNQLTGDISKSVLSAIFVYQNN